MQTVSVDQWAGALYKTAVLYSTLVPFEQFPSVVQADMGLWIFLAAVGGLVWLMVRAISKASMKRLEQGGAGPETVQDQKRKQEERKVRHEAVADAKKAKKEAAKKKKPSEKPAEPEPEEDKGPDLLLPPGKSVGEGLAKTRETGFVGRLGKLFAGKQVDESLLDQIEEVLFTADIGVKTSQKLVDALRGALSRKELSDSGKVWGHLKRQAREILEGAGEFKSLEAQPLETSTQPWVVLVIGVNGAGKTTTIGKLAHHLIADGKTVTIGAGDTFRAAAVDQLEVWARRVGAEIIRGSEGADPSSVLFDAITRAKEVGSDVVLCDTAGRLHTNVNLVEELKKVRRVISKAHTGAPHEVLLVLDSTNGQNAIQQAHAFGEALNVTNIALTKLDGTAKGGVVLGISDELKVPISWIGMGERTEDLKPFDSSDFVDALFEGME